MILSLPIFSSTCSARRTLAKAHCTIIYYTCTSDNALPYLVVYVTSIANDSNTAIIKNKISDTSSRVSNRRRLYLFARIIPRVMLKIKNPTISSDQLILLNQLNNTTL